MFIEKLWVFIYWYTRPIVKWFLRKTTKLCELQRICYGEKAGAPRVLGVERSLQLSRHRCIRDMVDCLDLAASSCEFEEPKCREMIRSAVRVVIEVKKINPQVHCKFVRLLEVCVEQVWGYRQLYHQVEALRRSQYDCDLRRHEDKLVDLWCLLMPDEELDGRVTKQWQHIGFQGDDPKTDFRGMGMLGLENLLFFAREYPGASKHVLSHSHHPKYGYTFAIVGINLTAMAYNLLKDGTAKTYVYNSHKKTAIRVFHQLYCYLFYEFDRFWIQSKPQNMMEFSAIQEKFEKRIRTALADTTTNFRINIAIDNI